MNRDSADCRSHSGFSGDALARLGLLVVVLGACGGTSGALPDAGTEPTFAQLTILDPPGDILGLNHAETRTLRVRYETVDLVPIAGAKVDFQLVATDDTNTGGATLSGSSAVTDATGTARTNLLAGAADARFSVRVTAPNAQPVTFFATVSAGGFADLAVRPVHSGWRALSSFDRVEVRLYHGSDVRCDSLDVDAPPTSLFPPRSMAGFDTVASFRNVRARTAYTLVAWGVGGVSEKNLAAGCVDIAPQQLPASPAELLISVADRDGRVPEGAVLESAFDVSALAVAVKQAGHERVWSVLACPAGAGQLVLDCALDALVDDGALDCVVNASNPTRQAIEAKRGAPVDGCRPATLPDSSPSLDAMGAASGDGSAFPTGPGLEALLTGRSNTLDLFALRSELGFRTTGSHVTHRLVSVSFDISGTSYALQLAPTARPLLENSNVPATVSLAGGLAIESHGFTLRYGSLAMAAFRDVVLSSAGLGDDAHTIGTALVAAVKDGGKTGCEAISKITCTAAGEPESCLTAACTTSLPALDDGLDAWWRYLDGQSLDFTLEGAASVFDAQDDLVVDGFGIDAMGTRLGVWSATMRLADGSTVDADGAFGSVMVIKAPVE